MAGTASVEMLESQLSKNLSKGERKMQEMPTASEKVEELARELERALIIIKLTEMLEDNKTLSEAIEALKKQ